jgi:hypothetical protein
MGPEIFCFRQNDPIYVSIWRKHLSKRLRMFRFLKKLTIGLQFCTRLRAPTSIYLGPNGSTVRVFT